MQLPAKLDIFQWADTWHFGTLRFAYMVLNCHCIFRSCARLSADKSIPKSPSKLPRSGIEPTVLSRTYCDRLGCICPDGQTYKR